MSSIAMHQAWIAFGLASLVHGWPNVGKVEQIKRLLGRDAFEWTSFGDSYSSGVGAGTYIPNSYRCLRYDNAYPVLINADPRIPPAAHEFHNDVCSGSTTSDVEAYQFNDHDMFGVPNLQYGDRPAFGLPEMATLSVGGNNIDFPGIIFNCILETKLPREEPRPCEEQKVITWERLIDPKMIDAVDGTIQKIVNRARQGPMGDQFRLYVTGFPQFFNDETDLCDTVTFARTANPKPDGKPHILLTKDIRKEYNAMSVQLNKNIASAVARNADRGVTWIPIDGVMDGHRFCEPNIHEPDQQNPNLWLFHYPYNEPSDAELDAALQNAVQRVGPQANNLTAYPTYSDYQNAVFDALADPGNTGVQDFIWRSIGNRVKVFHPQIPLHNAIRDLVLDQYIQDLEHSQQSSPAASSAPTQDQNDCHGISGDYWVMSRDVAIENVKAFCAQTSDNVTYNQGSVNELSLSVQDLNAPGSTRGPNQAPDCEGRFQRAVIDGCDGNDPVNNPHNYKFGSTLKTTDGWEYTMIPLSQQVAQVSCDISYKFWYDLFEIRGKNLPDAKIGANGEGLRSQLSGCGPITKWDFEQTTGNFQWYAKGQLPVGAKACVGRALMTAGGPDKGNCHGAGKRTLPLGRVPRAIDENDKATPMSEEIDNGPQRLTYSGELGLEGPTLQKRDEIDMWPGYGDEGKHVFRTKQASQDMEVQ